MKLPELYHWAPADRHDDIRRAGLVAGMAPTVATVAQPHISLGFCPASAWLVTGAMEWAADIPIWDLWQARVGPNDEVHIVPTFGPRLSEVRIRSVIPADRLWYVARRTA